jgi:PAS domain S-box-containing protein
MNRENVVGRALPLLLFAILAPPLRPQSTAAGNTQTPPVRRILILNEQNPSYPAIAMIDEAIRESFQGSKYRIEIYREYLDANLFPEQADQQGFQDFYIRKYQNRRPEVIITVGGTALDIMRELNKTSFQGIPVVFCLPGTEDSRVDSDFTGVTMGIDAAGTVSAALRLLPETTKIVVVGGMSSFERQQLQQVREQLQPYNGKLEISYVTDLSMPEVLGKLHGLSKGTIVLFVSMSSDAAGTRFSSNQAAPLITSASSVPVFTLFDVYLGHGEVGGDFSIIKAQGTLAGNAVLKILDGARPSDIPVATAANSYIFDWRALKRWGLSDGNLPPGSLILNREPTLWERGRKYFLTGIAVIVLQGLLISALFWQRAQKKRKESELKRSEEKFSKSFRHSPLAASIIRIRDSRYVDVNESFVSESGWKREEVIGRTPFEISLWATPDERPPLMKQLLENGSLHDSEYKIRRKDGQIRTYLASAELIDVDGERCALHVGADITERKVAEEAIASLSGRLINAQEEERSRIAREIHDDYQQRLALVANDLDGLRDETLDPEIKKHVRQLWNEVSELAGDMHSLSHRLHSSTLETLGLAAGVKAFCEEFQQQQGVQVGFRSNNLPRRVPPDSALCVFRVAQEALRNVKRHSCADRADVILEWTGEALHLMVADNGKGFDPKTPCPDTGIGIRSMEERLRFVGGRLNLHSQPSQGTTIEAWVPLKVAGKTAN